MGWINPSPQASCCFPPSLPDKFLSLACGYQLHPLQCLLGLTQQKNRLSPSTQTFHLFSYTSKEGTHVGEAQVNQNKQARQDLYLQNLCGQDIIWLDQVGSGHFRTIIVKITNFIQIWPWSEVNALNVINSTYWWKEKKREGRERGNEGKREGRREEGGKEEGGRNLLLYSESILPGETKCWITRKTLENTLMLKTIHRMLSEITYFSK